MGGLLSGRPRNSKQGPSMASGIDLDQKDRELLNLLQSAFPLTSRPYAFLGQRLGLSEEFVLERAKSLKARNVLREISAIFDSRLLGYQSSLVAMRFPEKALSSAARIINQHPGVSHNYARRGPFNLWFTIAVGAGLSLEAEVKQLAAQTKAQAVRLLPSLHVFKIGVAFDMVTGESASRDEGQSSGEDIPTSPRGCSPITEMDKAVVRELQQDLSLSPSPFTVMAGRMNLSEDALFALAADLKVRGILRRYGAVLHHRRAGFRANAMTVWNVPIEQIAQVGQLLAGHPAVSHCYQRPTYPDWPYSLFTMVHGTTRERCEQTIRELSCLTGVSDYTAIYSYRELKKTRVRYFV